MDKRKSHGSSLQIGEVARRAETTTRTVRYYMEEGFFDWIERSPGGFYLFDPAVVETIRYVKKLQDLGLPLQEIRALFQIRKEEKTGNAAYKRVSEKLEQHLALTEKKISEYRKLKKELQEAIRLVNQCAGCRKKPTRENCQACEVIKNQGVLPSPVGAIL